MRSLRQFEPDEEKLRELILYVSQKCADQTGFGSTKLNKILYFADFISYKATGKPITGVEYQRLQWGPAPRRMKPVLDSMKDSGALGMQEDRFSGGGIKKPVNLVDPRLELFSGREISLIDYVIEKFEQFTAAETSLKSHIWGGWKYARDGEIIPYESVFVNNKPLTAEETERGLEIAKERGLLDG